MKHIVTLYHCAGKFKGIENHFDSLKNLNLSDDLLCIQSKNCHKCNYPQHKADKTFFGTEKKITFMTKYNSINIRTSVFKSGSMMFDYNHKDELPIHDVVNILTNHFPGDIKLTKGGLVMKMVTWKTQTTDINNIKTYVQNNYKGNYDFTERASNIFPNVSYTIHGNKIRVGKKSITCVYRSPNDKEIDNFILMLQKYYGVTNDNKSEESEEESEEYDTNEMDE